MEIAIICPHFLNQLHGIQLGCFLNSQFTFVLTKGNVSKIHIY